MINKNVLNRYKDEPEFYQATSEMLEALELVEKSRPDLLRDNIIERLVEFDRIITFRVTWLDDNQKVHVNRGYRVQHNNAVGVYKGGLRFHPSVNLSIMKFLAFEQTFKNALTGLPIGGAKGGSDFDPKGKSDTEIMNFCQAFMLNLYQSIGPNMDVPAGDIGVGAKEIGYLFGYYKKIRHQFEGSMTGKGLSWGGLKGRKEATGYGVCFILNAYFKRYGDSFKDKKIIVSGSGNVAIYAAEKAIEMGAKVVAMSDSKGVVYNPKGINIELIKEIKEVKKQRIKEYVDLDREATYYEGSSTIYTLKCDIALPCATQNELNLESSNLLIKNGCKYIVEGANMPTTYEAAQNLINHGCIYLPGKAANAGGVACSVFEMRQNSSFTVFMPEEVYSQLEEVMTNIFTEIDTVSLTYDIPKNYLLSANIAGFIRVAEAMLAQGSL